MQRQNAWPEILAFLLVLGVFLSWGFAIGWRDEVVRIESHAWMETFDTRASTMGIEADQALKDLLGDGRRQKKGSFAEGLVIGLRQILSRLFVIGCFLPLLFLAMTGFIIEARNLRTLRAASFGYTSPIRHLEMRRVPLWIFGGFSLLLIAPLPLPPWVLPGILTLWFATLSVRYALYMKQA